MMLALIRNYLLLSEKKNHIQYLDIMQLSNKYRLINI